jgi:integrase/recombinase XerD
MHKEFQSYLTYLQTIEAPRAKFTLSRRHLGLLNDFLQDQHPLSVRFGEANEFLSWLTKEYAQFSSGYVRNIVKSIKAFYRFVIKEGKVSEDPFSYVELPKMARSFPKDIPTNEEVQSLIDVIPKTETRDRAMIEVFYGSGIRISELIGLKLKDINHETGFMTIFDVKNKQERMVPMNDMTSFSIQLYESGQRKELFNMNPHYQRTTDKQEIDPERLFLKRGGYPLCVWKINTLIKQYTRQAKIKKNLTPHSFRHACATGMIKNGASIRYVQFMLGHEDITSTMIYTRIGIDDLKKAIDIFHPKGAIK